MLAESIIWIGRSIVESDLPIKERIRWLTDVSSENCKNYFQNVFLIELGERQDAFHRLKLGDFKMEKKKENFHVDSNRSISFPILYPNGGNPINAQGVYPIPCYLMYDPHIKTMDKADKFLNDVLMPRLDRTISFRNWDMEDKKEIAGRVLTLLEGEAATIITKEKQLGILMIFDTRISVFKKLSQNEKKSSYLGITESYLHPGQQLYLNGEEALQGIVEARFDEASSLGKLKNEFSTFTNKKVDEVVSIYNKSWLWLSPTWEMPRSIYWEKEEWTKGIKVDRGSYEAFLYGAQFLKQIQVPISSSILKEMFAPIENIEAKKHKKATSYEPIFGIPIILPLFNADLKDSYKKFRKMLKNESELNSTDLHLEILAGMKESIVPGDSDDYRLTILYYSGDLSRGAMHIRAIIEDVIPSVAHGIQKILKNLNMKGLSQIQKVFGLEKQDMYRLKTLPAILGNAFGSGYLWSTLQDTFHRKDLKIDRLYTVTMKKLNELNNKANSWGMKQELVFYYSFLYFFKRYQEKILGKEKGVKELADWQELISAYHKGEIQLKDITSSEALGFITGMLLKQFSNSYYKKTNKEFLKQRVIKFGSKLTPEMLWKNGLLRCEELAQQWNMKLANNFRGILSLALLSFIEANKANWLVSEKEIFMTAFWSGYLIYKKKEGA